MIANTLYHKRALTFMVITKAKQNDADAGYKKRITPSYMLYRAIF